MSTFPASAAKLPTSTVVMGLGCAAPVVYGLTNAQSAYVVIDQVVAAVPGTW